MDTSPDLVAATPPSRRNWLVVAGFAAAVVVAAIVFWPGGGDDAPLAGDTTTIAADGAVTTADPAVPGTVPPVGSSTVVPGSDPPPAEAWLPGLMLVWDDGAVRATWTSAAGGDHFTYRFGWESADDTGGDFGTLPAGTLSYRNDAPCGATITFEVLAWTASDLELGRGEASTVSGACVPAVVLPSNLRGEAQPTGVRFRWDGGTGYRAAFEVTMADAGGSGTDAGNLGTETSYPVGAYCDTAVTFTLFALEESGSAELGRLSATFETPPCPGTFVTSGNRRDVAPGTSGGSVIACPGGSAVIGGGFSAGINVALMPYPGWVYRSEPDGTGWAARLGAPPERDLLIWPAVLCMAHTETETRSATVAVPSDSLRTVVAECPAGPYWVAVGGGFQVTPYGPRILVSAPEGSRSWRVTAYNENASAADLRATVVCLSVPNAASQIVRSSVSIGDGSWGAAEVTCPAGWTMMGGGWVTLDASVEGAVHLAEGGATRWRVFGHNQEFATPGPAASLDAAAVCMRFR